MAVAHDDTSETPPCGGAQLTPENPNIAGPWPSREAAPASGSAPPGPPFTPFRFYEWLDEFGEANPSLLWAHVTNGWVLSQMLASQRLAAPEPCPYFKKPLIYAFYGRPAYKEKSDDSTRSEPRAPVVILLKPSIEQFAHGVWPFDSGAFHTGRYSTWLAPHMTLDGFSLGDIPGRARRYVTAFFGDNEAYWRMRAKPPREITL